MLLITENGSQKKVDLDIGHLRNGSVIYRKVSGDVDFRLEVFANEKVSIAETVHFRMEASRPAADSESLRIFPSRRQAKGLVAGTLVQRFPFGRLATLCLAPAVPGFADGSTRIVRG